MSLARVNEPSNEEEHLQLDQDQKTEPPRSCLDKKFLLSDRIVYVRAELSRISNSN